MHIQQELIKEEGKYRIYRLNVLADESDYEREQIIINEYFMNNKVFIEDQLISEIVKAKIHELNTGNWIHDIERVHDKTAFYLKLDISTGENNT